MHGGRTLSAEVRNAHFSFVNRSQNKEIPYVGLSMICYIVLQKIIESSLG